MKKFRKFSEAITPPQQRQPEQGREAVGGRFTSSSPKGASKPAPQVTSEAKDEQEYGYEGDMAMNQLKTIIRHSEYLMDMLKPDTDLPEWVQSKITLAADYIQTSCDYMTSELDEGAVPSTEKVVTVKHKTSGKELVVTAQKAKEYQKQGYHPVKEEHLEEGRPSQRHPLEGHEYHKKTDAELVYIAKDAHKAAEAMKSHNTTAENKYRDQANDSATVRYFRQKNGMPDWYKKKYGHMKEEVVAEEVKTPPFAGPYKKAKDEVKDKSGAKHTKLSRVKHLAKMGMKKVNEEGMGDPGLIDTNAKLTLAKKKTNIVKTAAKNAKEKNSNKFNADPVLSSPVAKQNDSV